MIFKRAAVVAYSFDHRTFTAIPRSDVVQRLATLEGPARNRLVGIKPNGFNVVFAKPSEGTSFQPLLVVDVLVDISISTKQRLCFS